MSTTTVRQQNQLSVLNASDDKLFKKLQSKFTEEEQQLFVQSFCMYLNHDQEAEYIVDLDDIWEWLGFARKENCKKVLEKHFQEGMHYKVLILHPQENSQRGRPNEQILMNIKTFKKLCLKANTKKADDVHNYYIKMEETLHEYLLETANRQAKLEREKALIESHRKKSVNYFGTVGKIDGIDIGKFGWSNDVWTRIEAHKKELGEDFVLECIVECERNVLLEKKLKARGEIVQRRVKKVINGKVQTELVKLDEDFQPEDIKRIMDEINEEIQTEADKQRRHEERMLELHVKQSELDVRQSELKVHQSELNMQRDVQLKQLDLELKKLDIQSQQIQLQSQQAQFTQAYSSSLQQARARSSGPKQVSQYTLDGGFIKTYNSIKEAATAVQGDRTSLGRACADSRRYKNFVWKLATE